MGNFSVGVHLGGTNLRVATYAPGRGLRNQRQVRTRIQDGPASVAEDILQLIRDSIAARGSESTCVGACVAAPGPLELPEGRFHEPPNLPGWDGFDCRKALGKQLPDVPLYFENDANAAALAECHLGSGRQLGLDNLCLLILGTGVGLGIISEGRIVHGANGLAGEGGHVSVWPDGEFCNCGNQGCLETYAAARAIERRAKRLADKGSKSIARLLKRQPDATAHDFYALAVSGDKDARSIFHEAGRAIGIYLASLINALNPALILVAGGLSDAWPLLAPEIFDELLHRSSVYRLTRPGSRFRPHTIVQKATLGAEGGLAGAALYPFVYVNRSTPSRRERDNARAAVDCRDLRQLSQGKGS